MEGNSSGEELVAVKTRKPYTITKQRERWTEEEHNRFLEALKLYGRAWQRIEEHVGTKTAVQIRSHAQKFFNKLEKEALEKGIPLGQPHEIDIPPPRPKRKPSSPYPRKSNTCSLAPREAVNGKPLKSMSLLSTSKVVDTESDALQEKLTAAQKLQCKEMSEDASCSEVLNVLQDTLSASISSVNKSSFNHGKYMEFLPTKEKTEEKITIDKFPAPREVDWELDKNAKSFIEQETDGVQGNCSKPQINLTLEEGTNTSKVPGLTSMDTPKGDQTYPKKPPMYIMDGNGAKSMQTEGSDGQGGNANANASINPGISAIPVQNLSTIGSMHLPFPAFTPFTHFQSNQDAYRSFLNISSTFSSLIVSTLLQNPAVHAAASLAASFWSSAGVDTYVHSTPEILTGEIPKGHLNPTPSLEAIAAATVAAAAAWWTAQGLLPWFPPLPGFAFAPANTTTVPSANIAQVPASDGTIVNPLKEIQQVRNQNQSETLKPQHHSSKSLSLSSSDSDDGGIGTARNKEKQVRSSCGSNTPSSSEVETDTIGKKQEKENDESKAAYFSNTSACETNHRRFRSSGSLNESWKEVSEEGRLAFQELFKRQVLPQSFSPSHTEEAATTMKKGEASESPVDLNKNICSATDLNRLHSDAKEEMCVRSNDSIVHGKLKVHRTGFKPYKRCAAESANRIAAAEEAGNKRIRLQGEAST